MDKGRINEEVSVSWGKASNEKQTGEYSWGLCSLPARGMWHRVIAWKGKTGRHSWATREPLCRLRPTHTWLLMLTEFSAHSWYVGSSGTHTFIQIFSWISPQVLLISNRFHCEQIWFSFSITSCSAHKSSWLRTLKFNTDFHCNFILGFL